MRPSFCKSSIFIISSDFDHNETCRDERFMARRMNVIFLSAPDLSKRKKKLGHSFYRFQLSGAKISDSLNQYYDYLSYAKCYPWLLSSSRTLWYIHKLVSVDFSILRHNWLDKVVYAVRRLTVKLIYISRVPRKSNN